MPIEIIAITEEEMVRYQNTAIMLIDYTRSKVKSDREFLIVLEILNRAVAQTGIKSLGLEEIRKNIGEK